MHVVNAADRQVINPETKGGMRHPMISKASTLRKIDDTRVVVDDRAMCECDAVSLQT